MDEYNIILDVRGEHVHGVEESKTEFLTQGWLRREDNGVCSLEFEESELTGHNNNTTVTKVVVNGKDDLWLIRSGHSGTVESELRLRKHQLLEMAYHTPLGIMQISIFTTQLASEIAATEGSIDLEYIITIGEQTALNRLNIGYRSRSYSELS